jgi:uncharacterized protein (DUF302 family)
MSKRFEVITDEDCILIYAKTHQTAKTAAEKNGHKVFATFDVMSCDEKIWDFQGHAEMMRYQ